MMSKIRNWLRRNFIGLNRRSLHIRDYVRGTKSGRLYVDKKKFIESGELDQIIKDVRKSSIYKRIEAQKNKKE